jgi:hypothetical protein
MLKISIVSENKMRTFALLVADLAPVMRKVSQIAGRDRV